MFITRFYNGVGRSSQNDLAVKFVIKLHVLLLDEGCVFLLVSWIFCLDLADEFSYIVEPWNCSKKIRVMAW